MYYYVSGQVAHVEPYLAVIDCGGVGYACRTTSYTLSQIKKGDRAKLFTYLSVREDAMDLSGFCSQQGLELFPAWDPRRRWRFYPPQRRPIWL